MSDWYKASSHSYCPGCGGRVKKSKEWVSHYKEETGEPVMRYYLACENWRWWKLTHHFHAEFEGDDMVISYDY